MKRVEEFTLEGKNFYCLDLSMVNTASEFTEIAATFKAVAAKYPEKSLHIIVNLENIKFDSDLKRILSDSLAHCAPYGKCWAVCGIDGCKKMMMFAICKTVGLPKMHFAFAKVKAIEWLLQQE